eukprot:3631844-Prorocentrum_lima.AAC.1
MPGGGSGKAPGASERLVAPSSPPRAGSCPCSPACALWSAPCWPGACGGAAPGWVVSSPSASDTPQLK